MQEIIGHARGGWNHLANGNQNRRVHRLERRGPRGSVFEGEAFDVFIFVAG